MTWTIVAFETAAEALSFDYDPGSRYTLVDNDKEITTILNNGIATLTEQGGPNKMRDYLKTNNVVGYRSRSRGCVMAQYFNGLLREQHIDMTTSVSGLSVMAINGSWRRSTPLELPRDVGVLVSKFDRGDYPELDAEIQALLDAEQRKTQLVNA